MLGMDHLAGHAKGSLLAKRIDDPPRVTQATSFAQTLAGGPLTMRHAVPARASELVLSQ